MAFRKKIGVLRDYYVSAHKRRMNYFNLKWRLFVILLAVASILVVNDYVHDKYALAVVYNVDPQGGGLNPAGYTLAGKMFDWFMTGVLFGIVALGVLNEGEYVIALRKIAAELERGAEKTVEKTVGLGVAKNIAKAFGQGGRKNVKRPKK